MPEANETVLKRITPEEVVAAYRKTGLQPIQGEYFNMAALMDAAVEGCGACALGALYSAADCSRRRTGGHVLSQHFRDEGYHDAYLAGFVSGFDGMNASGFAAEWQLGLQDGQAALQAVREQIGEPTLN